MVTLADRLTIASPEARATRRQLAGVRGIFLARRDELRARVPSYMWAAIDALDHALDEWTCDEQAIDAGAADVTIGGARGAARVGST